MGLFRSRASKEANKERKRVARENRQKNRIEGRNYRTDARQNARTSKHKFKNEADAVAYANGLTPIDRTANLIEEISNGLGAIAPIAMGLMNPTSGLAGLGGLLGGSATRPPNENEIVGYDEHGNPVDKNGAIIPLDGKTPNFLDKLMENPVLIFLIGLGFFLMTSNKSRYAGR